MRKNWLLGAALALIAGAAYAGGQFTNQLPAQSAYGPLQGTETIPVDTNLAAGAQPQTISVATSILSGARNKLIGGEFSVSPLQRFATTKGIASLAGISPTAAVMSADRWWVIAPAAGVTVTVDSTAATATIPALANTKALRVARTSSGAAGQICLGQTLDKVASTPFIGKNAIFSFWEFNGAGMSATGGNFVVNVDYTSAADTAGTQATLGYAGGNGSKFALGDAGQAGAPTNYVNAVTQAVMPAGSGTIIAGNSTVAGAPNTIAQFAGSTAWTRYAVVAPIPVNIPGTTTAVTGVSVSVCFTPTATTAISTDYIELEGLQLEAAPTGVITPNPLELRSAAIEQLLAKYYWFYYYEDQALVSPVPGVSCTTTTSTTAAVCNLTFPEAMRIVPVVKFTDGFQLFTSTAYTTVGAANTLAVYANTLTTVATNTGVMFSLVASTVPAVGTANFLMNLGTSSATGIIVASAEP